MDSSNLITLQPPTSHSSFRPSTLGAGNIWQQYLQLFNLGVCLSTSSSFKDTKAHYVAIYSVNLRPVNAHGHLTALAQVCCVLKYTAGSTVNRSTLDVCQPICPRLSHAVSDLQWVTTAIDRPAGILWLRLLQHGRKRFPAVAPKVDALPRAGLLITPLTRPEPDYLFITRGDQLLLVSDRASLASNIV